MPILDRVEIALLGIALAGAAAFGIAVTYHFFRYSPNQNVTKITVITYAIGVVIIVISTFLAIILT
jgi:hypothetical protein